MLTDTQKKVLIFLVNLLNENNIPFQASGGLAAIAYGAKRPLYDIDLEIYKKDVETVRVLLRDYIVEDWNNELEGEEDQFDLWMMTLEISDVSIDINQVEGCRIKSKNGEWVPQPEVMEVQMRNVEGIEIPVQAKEALIAYKKLLARETDFEDIRQIS